MDSLHDVVKEGVESNKIMLEVLRDLSPKNQRAGITQELVDKLNEWDEDPLLVGSFKDNMLSYIDVLKGGRYKIDDYMNAVRYVSYKLLGSNDIDAYAKTFPERYTTLLGEGLTRSQMSPYTAAYKKNKLVNQIFEQTLVPHYVLNAPMYQQALNVQAELMIGARSEMVRMQAANSLLTHLKAPETTKIELDIGVSQGDVIDDYERAMSAMVAKQKELIVSGGDLKSITNAKIKVNEPEEVIEAELEDWDSGGHCMRN